ncbi:hypothetical protein VHEMI06625 [[Torrubiella] hemipterigena]|uniref:Uncharacterized protein n=1 Tax=[Torrubiella] hemipterigena TaxID=1531966 RepID=A0A0A1TLF3_9HYPO|nr:hypothetical protein VHEMI06625 [[Torrubiella] hemipterigena]
MRLNCFVAATVAFAGLATSAAVQNDVTNLVDRGTTKPAAAPLVAGKGIFKNIKATQATWDPVKATCPGGRKRGLESRALPPGFFGVEVAMGTHNSHGVVPIGLYTDGLVTCFGIVIKGTATSAKSDANTRWLFHMVASEAASNWDDFQKNIEDAKLANMKGYMSLPAPADIGSKVQGRTWNPAEQDLTNKMITSTKAALEKLTGHPPVIHMRSMQPPSSMQISGTGEVKAGDTVLV